MVRVRDESYILEDGRIDKDAWIATLSANPLYHDHIHLIKRASQIAEFGASRSPDLRSYLDQGLAIAETLVELDLDSQAIISALIYPCYHYTDISIDDITEELGKEVAKLVHGISQMDAISYLHHANTLFTGSTIDNIRKMLIAMVDDVRVVLIKLAERLCLLRQTDNLTPTAKLAIAQETMDIYAPLANRLGIGHIKWEMEDLAFRQLNKEQYKTIASGLKARRVERDKFIHNIVNTLKAEILSQGIENAKIYGRSKHIHSIYNKMVRKQLPLEKIYDVQAVRVLVDTVEQCYGVLSIIHNRFEPIPQEFDDYIAQPKPNGYQSLHTAVKTADGRVFEVQIRTRQMHAQAELGVAAHWRYKEGGVGPEASHERKIEWLREVLSWQRECITTGTPVAHDNQAYLEDRIYVFTPKQDVIDLPKGSTPLDFAYSIHTELGHRCRGAKVNGDIVPLTYVLKTGEQIQLMTTKLGKPSRDWLNPHAGYVTTPRARAKIVHWFRHQDYDKYLALGKDILEKEYKKMELQQVDFEKLATAFHLAKPADFFVALGAGDISLGQVAHKLKPVTAPLPKLKTTLPGAPKKSSGTQINTQGIGHLETRIAQCCKPLPGDPIIGYISLGKGIAIHRQDCQNIHYESAHKHDRFLEVDWGTEKTTQYDVDIQVIAANRNTLVHDITPVLTQEKASLLAFSAQSEPLGNEIQLALTIGVGSIHTLTQVLQNLKKIPGVTVAQRINI